MLRTLQKPLFELVDAKYATAKASENLSFAASSLAILRTESGLPFQLRYCPSLAKKPVPSKDRNTTPKKKINPFKNPDPELFVTDLPPGSKDPTHFLVLNKFPIIPSHFILATKVNKAQTAALEPEDLEAAYDCLRSWDGTGSGKRLYGFFNSGEHSGASQAHRHLQFVPVEGMIEGDDKAEWDVLMDQIVDKQATMPFEVFWEPVSDDTSTEQLHAIYIRLFEEAKASVERYIAQHPANLKLNSTANGSSPFSYNLGMTTKALMIMPRRAEGSTLRDAEGHEVGFAAFNGTVLAGTMMVKREAEWELLKGNNSLLNELLKTIGIPRSGNMSRDTRI